MNALKLELDRTLGCFALLLILATPTGAQETESPLTWATEHTISSTVLNEDRPVFLALPEGYDPEAAYPVIYVLDAQWHFLHTVASARFLAADAGRMPKAIVVGLPVEDPADRRADFVPPVAGGSADTFTAFLRDELIPWVEARHRTRPFRVLIGHSLSGLFATYLLNSQPDLVSGYIAIDPSLHMPLPSGEAYVTETDELSQRTPGLAASWYMTLAGHSVAAQVSAVRHIVDTFESAETSDQFRWAWKHMLTETHMSVPARSVYDGLEWIFSGFDPSHFLKEIRADGAAVLPRIDEQYRRLSRRMG